MAGLLADRAIGTQSGDRTHDFLFVGQALSQAELSGYGALLLLGEVLKNPGGPHGDRTRRLKFAKLTSPLCDFWPISCLCCVPVAQTLTV